MTLHLTTHSIEERNSQCSSHLLDFQFSSTTTFVTVDGRGIGNSNPYKPANTEYKPVSALK